MTGTDGEGLAAALLQISQHAERLALLDTREGGHHQAIRDELAKLQTAVQGLRGTVADQAEILRSLDGIDETLAGLAAQVASLLPPETPEAKGYQPIPTVQWWHLSDEDRDEAMGRIRSWVSRIYRPYYGHLAGRLGECWEEHPLCLVQLDWLSELWSVLHLQPERSARDLAAQAELGTRIIPAVADQLATETASCEHTRAANGHQRAGAWSR